MLNTDNDVSNIDDEREVCIKDKLARKFASTSSIDSKRYVV